MHHRASVTVFSILLTLLCLAQVRFAAKSSKRSLCSKNVTYSSNQQANEHSTPINAKCIELNHPYCLDIKLPYGATTLPDYIPSLYPADIDEIQSFLERWKGARALPECWLYLQKALCSTLMPECVEDHLTGKVSRISRSHVEICNDLIPNCKFITRHFGWPPIFNCSDTNLYAKNCNNELRELKLNRTSATCQYPLVSSADNNNRFKDIDGCSLNCRFPISNPSDQSGIGIFIRILCTLGLLSTLLAIMLFGTNAANNKSSRIAKVIIRCNICEFIKYVGWSLQIFFNRDIACSPTGSSLYSLEFAADACLMSFFLTYVPSLSSLIWCAYLGRLCYEKLGNPKGPQDNAQVNLSHLDLLAFIVPSALFVVAACLKLIDGHGLYGICTVGQQSMVVKAVFIFVPKIVGNLLGNVYFYMTIYTLTQIKWSPSMRRNFARITALAILNTMDVIVSVGSYIYIHRNKNTWIESIDNYIACNSNLRGAFNDTSDFETIKYHQCSISAEPSAIIYYLDLFPTLAIGVVIASWACCESNFRGIRRKLIDMLEDEKERQRRARPYIEDAIADTNGQLLDTEVVESRRDLVDLSSRTHVGANVDLRLENVNQPDSRNVVERGSLESCSIGYDSNSSIHYPAYHEPRAKRRARNIVQGERFYQEEARRRQAEAAPSNIFPPHCQLILDLLAQPHLVDSLNNIQLHMQILKQLFPNGQPPNYQLNLGGSDATPQFIHGTGGTKFGSMSSMK